MGLTVFQVLEPPRMSTTTVKPSSRTSSLEREKKIFVTRDLPGVALVITFFTTLFTVHRKYLIAYWSCRFTNFDVSFGKTFYFCK